MGLRSWIGRSSNRVRKNGVEGLHDSMYEVYTGCWRYLGWHVPRGINVYDLEWDALIILDACRVDLLKEVRDEYPFLDRIGQIESVGSMSEEWLAKTFTESRASEMEETVYVTANVFSEEVLEASQFRYLDEVWRDGWDNEIGIVPPRTVTDRAISAAREYNPTKLIIHYMQPHHPFIGEHAPDSFESDPFGSRDLTTVEDALRHGDIERDEYWRAYRGNLRAVLESVELLLSNLDAPTTIISADHGDALGEWGLYGHPAGCLHPAVTTVPWVETTAKDRGEYEPEFSERAEDKAEAEERLRELGYL